MTEDSHGHPAGGQPYRNDPLYGVRRLKGWVRLIVYPAIAFSGLIYHLSLDLSPLETLVPLGIGYAISTVAIEYAFAQIARLRKQGIYEDILHILSSALDMRDQATGGHSRRVAGLCVTVAKQLRINSDHLTNLERAAILHDIGKVAVADAILAKPGPLDEAEWREMKKHPVVGYQMVKDVPFLTEAAEIILSHHEHFDGTGYPRGFKGEEIPLGARIFSVVDAYDAMTSDRPYRTALPHEHALQEITRNVGSQFDPRVVDAFLEAELRGLIQSGDTMREHAPPLSYAAT